MKHQYVVTHTIRQTESPHYWNDGLKLQLLSKCRNDKKLFLFTFSYNHNTFLKMYCKVRMYSVFDDNKIIPITNLNEYLHKDKVK